MTQSSPDAARQEALTGLAASAVANIPHVEFASITVLDAEGKLSTPVATDPLAEQLDEIQFQLREGPCYAAVTDQRMVLIQDPAQASVFPTYGPRAAELGIGTQMAIQLINDDERAGLNLYSRTVRAFDRSTVEFAELFATQAASILGYAEQIEQLSEALHTRTDIGIALGILMERFGITSDQAFSYLVRTSNQRNIKIRLLARQVADGNFDARTHSDEH